ncbi:hypothetical protein GGER_21970 [Serratia rubidaea]
MDIMTTYDYLLLDNAIGTVFNQDADIITGAEHHRRHGGLFYCECLPTSCEKQNAGPAAG